MSLLLMIACEGLPTTVSMWGTVQNAPRNEGTPVEGAVVAILGPDLEPYAESAATDAEGAFTVDVPAGQTYYVNVTGAGFLPTGFSGNAGTADFYSGDGYPWLASSAFLETLRADFSSCPTAQAEGAVVTGEARLFFAVEDYDELPVEPTSTVTVTGSDAVPLTTCYLDDGGLSSADATQTGTSGRFAVFGVPEGPLLAETTWTPAEGTAPVAVYGYFVAEGGIIPMYPALVELAE